MQQGRDLDIGATQTDWIPETVYHVSGVMQAPAGSSKSLSLGDPPMLMGGRKDKVLFLHSYFLG